MQWCHFHINIDAFRRLLFGGFLFCGCALCKFLCGVCAHFRFAEKSTIAKLSLPFPKKLSRFQVALFTATTDRHRHRFQFVEFPRGKARRGKREKFPILLIFWGSNMQQKLTKVHVYTSHRYKLTEGGGKWKPASRARKNIQERAKIHFNAVFLFGVFRSFPPRAAPLQLQNRAHNEDKEFHLLELGK